MTSGADPFSILNKNPNQSLYMPPKKAPKVNRYKAGVKPVLEGEDSSDSDSDFDMFSDNKTQVSQFTTNSTISMGNIGLISRSKILKKNPNAVKIQSKVIKKSKGGAAVRRVSRAKPVEKKIEIKGKVEVVKRRRNRRNIQQELKSDNQGPEMIEESQDGELNFRNVKMQEVEMMNQGAGNEENEADETSGGEESESEYEDSGSEYESEDGQTVNQIKRPVFIRKDERYAQALELQTDLQNEIERNKRKRTIKEQNKLLVVEAKSKRIKDDKEELGSDAEIPNDDDDDEDVAYEKWKVRELQRLKRDKEKREKEFREREATERRRLMTDEERAKEDKKIGKYKKEEKSSYQFMQKYYHKGIFFQHSDDPIFQRDYNIGVGTDNFDKSTLMRRLQVRRGDENKRGKSKHTHLGDLDTTNFDPDYQVDEALRQKAMKKMGGYKDYGAFNRPSRKSKR